MTHIATRSKGILCYRCSSSGSSDGHAHFAKVDAVVVSEGVLMATITATSPDGMDFTDAEDPYDILLPLSSLVYYESEAT